MSHAISGASKPETPTYKTGGEKLTRALVVEEVRIIEVPKVYNVPVIRNVETEQIKYITKEETQVRYKEEEKSTINYVVKEEPTVKYIPREEETIRYIPIDVKVERPVLIDKPYERPVVREKEYTIATIKDIDNLRELLETIPKLATEIASLKVELDKLKGYKLVEQVVKVPKIEWINTPVERVIWKDVEREAVNADKG